MAKRKQALREHSDPANEFPNPSTTVFKVIEELKEM